MVGGERERERIIIDTLNGNKNNIEFLRSNQLSALLRLRTFSHHTNINIYSYKCLICIYTTQFDSLFVVFLVETRWLVWIVLFFLVIWVASQRENILFRIMFSLPTIHIRSNNNEKIFLFWTQMDYITIYHFYVLNQQTRRTSTTPTIREIQWTQLCVMLLVLN